MTLTQKPLPARGGGAQHPPRRAVALLGLALGYFMVLLDMTVLAVAEPDLARSLHASVAGLQWATTGYTVAFGALLLSAGAVADRYGADRMFRLGVTAFGLASLACAFAPDLGTLVGLRVLLGIAAAAAVPASLALVARLYPDPAERTRALAAWAAFSGSALAAGPVVGGALVAASSWRAIFLLNVPVAALTLLCTRTAAMRSPRGERRVDWAAQLAACAVLALLTDALIAAGARRPAHAGASAAGAVLALAVFVLLERRSATPVLDRVLLRTPGVRAGLAVGAAVNFALTGTLFVLPLLFRDRHGLGALASGLAFLPMTVPFTANPPLTGRLINRVGPRLPTLLGLSLLAAGGASLALAARLSDAYLPLLPGLLLTGYGVSFVLPALVAAVIGLAPAGSAGAVGGLLNAVRQTGATLGVAVMGAFLGAGAVTPAAVGWAFGLSAAACAVAAAAFARASGGG